MKVTPHSIEEARYIEEMTRTAGWSILRGEAENRIKSLTNELINSEFEPMKANGIIHEIRALNGLLLYVANRQKKLEGGTQ